MYIKEYIEAIDNSLYADINSTEKLPFLFSICVHIGCYDGYKQIQNEKNKLVKHCNHLKTFVFTDENFHYFDNNTLERLDSLNRQILKLADDELMLECESQLWELIDSYSKN